MDTTSALSALVTLVLTLIGNWLVNRIAERRKEKREDRLRFMDARKAAYTQCLLLSFKFQRKTLLRAHAIFRREAPEMPEDSFVFMVEEVPDELFEAFTVVGLVGSPKVARAADILFIALTTQTSALFEAKPEANDQLEAGNERIALAQSEFLSAVRLEFGLDQIEYITEEETISTQGTGGVERGN